MAQKWYQKASVQTAIVSACALIVVALIPIALQVPRLQSENQKLRDGLDEKTAEIQRLETLLVPFKTIALERFTGSEAEALGKLAERLKILEEQLGDVDRLREIAAKHEFTPISPELRKLALSSLSRAAVTYAEHSIKLEITHETWASPATRRFAEQLAALLKEAGLDVSGPEFATVYLVGPAYPLEWGFNPEQQDLVNKLYQALLPIIKPSKKYANRKSFEKGRIRLHFGGQVVFEPNGAVLVE
jgi:hypothetical protein